MNDAARARDDMRDYAIRRSQRDDADFVSAARHSRRVRILKFALPAVALLVSAVFLGYTLIPNAVHEAVDLGTASIEDGQLVIANPTLDGFTQDKLPYTMTAARARQAIGPANAVIHLDEIEATIPIDAETEARISAARGSFDRANDRLTLGGTLTVSTSSGLSARLQSAEVDLASNELTTNDPVAIELKGMHITAGRFRASDGGKTLIFEDHVRMELDPARLQRIAQQEGEGNRGDE